MHVGFCSWGWALPHSGLLFLCSQCHFLVSHAHSLTQSTVYDNCTMHVAWLMVDGTGVVCVCCLLAQLRGQPLFITQGKSVLMRWWDVEIGKAYSTHTVSPAPLQEPNSQTTGYYCGLGYNSRLQSVTVCLPPSVIGIWLSVLPISPSLSLSLPPSLPSSSIFLSPSLSPSITFKVLHYLHGTLPTGRATSITSSSSITFFSLNQLISEHLVTWKFSILWSRLGWVIWLISAFNFSSNLFRLGAICLSV